MEAETIVHANEVEAYAGELVSTIFKLGDPYYLQEKMATPVKSA